MASVKSARTDSDDGFGLVEIVVSMFILALIAIAFLPLLIQGVQVAAQNRTLATATQLIHDQIEQARAIGTCDALAAFGASVSQPNANFTLTRVVEHFDDDSFDPCDTDRNGTINDDDFPGVVKLILAVTKVGSADTLVEASTLVLVHSEN